MALGGWKSIAMVMCYAHVNASNLAPGAMRLGEKMGTPTSDNEVSLRKQGDSARPHETLPRLGSRVRIPSPAPNSINLAVT
jgi:hypothetical protein